MTLATPDHQSNHSFFCTRDDSVLHTGSVEHHSNDDIIPPYRRWRRRDRPCRPEGPHTWRSCEAKGTMEVRGLCFCMQHQVTWSEYREIVCLSLLVNSQSMQHQVTCLHHHRPEGPYTWRSCEAKGTWEVRSLSELRYNQVHRHL
jgi:hypothetical protein